LSSSMIEPTLPVALIPFASLFYRDLSSQWGARFTIGISTVAACTDKDLDLASGALV